jgi:DNA invertase Pin-like site-specific DNA recombinase
MYLYGQYPIGHLETDMRQTILYARVSTADQDASHQLTQAEAAGFKIDEVITDDGVSGVTTKLSERPQGKRLFDRLRRGDVLVVRWVDRLGRNYQDVTDTIRAFMRQGVVVRTVINGMTFDGATTDPMQEAVRDALIAFMAATAQAQAEATKEAQRAGIEANKGDPIKYRGKKPSYSREALETVLTMSAEGAGTSAIAKAAHSDTSDQVFRRHMISHSGVSDHPEMTPSGAVW